MTKATQFYVYTLKEKPAETEVISHQLMIRAGLISQLTSGIYNWLPLGLRVVKKIERIVCEEMEAIGCNQLLLPAVQPAGLWKQSTRWNNYGPELLRFQDRHNNEYCLGPTHEEVITDFVRRQVHSYKSLPLSFFQVQTKFRDEIRPRFGVMRSREFIMKDAYSFHANQQSLQETYDDMFKAYNKIFTRLQLRYRSVDADNGSIGGKVSCEFHVLAQSGEDELAISSKGSFAANIESTPCPQPAQKRPAPSQQLEKAHTPQANTIAKVCKQLASNIEKSLKILVVHAAQSSKKEPRLLAVALRGDHQLNEIKAQNHPAIYSPLQYATAEEMKQHNLHVGYIGPVGLPIAVICDYAASQLHDFICGANEEHYHYCGVNWQRDCNYTETADLRNICAGDPSPDGQGVIEIHKGIEVGHIFQLGTTYSQSLEATFDTPENISENMHMGCYGIGISRIVAAHIEQSYDEKGIIWTKNIAPFQVHILALRYNDSKLVQKHADTLYNALQTHGCDVLLDDRALRTGILFTQADLLGMPYQVIISERNSKQHSVEVVVRANGKKQLLSLAAAVDFLADALT